MYKLIAVETHPIQYKAPLFRLLAQRDDVDLTVLYAMLPDTRQQGAGFGVAFDWDQPLLDGYAYEVLENRAKDPGVTHFGGCDTPGVRGVLKRLQPDAVLVNGWVVKSCLQALWACRRLGIPCMVRGEANLLRPRAWWKHAAHRLLLKQYQAYLAIGSANRAFYRSHGCPSERIFNVPYVVNNDWFAQEAEKRVGSRATLRQQWGITDDAVVFLFVGKLEDKKHPGDLLEALRQMPSALRERAHVLIAGSGPLLEVCRAQAEAQALPVTFAGFVNQSVLPDAYAAADVLVLPSDAGETWGLVVNESMASGRPAIVSLSAGCCEDLVVEGETGHAFEVRDIAALAGLMCRYVENPRWAGEQGQRAREHIAKFSLQVAVAGIVEGVRETLKTEKLKC